MLTGWKEAAALIAKEIGQSQADGSEDDLIL